MYVLGGAWAVGPGVVEAEPLASVTDELGSGRGQGLPSGAGQVMLPFRATRAVGGGVGVRV